MTTTSGRTPAGQRRYLFAPLPDPRAAPRRNQAADSADKLLDDFLGIPPEQRGPAPKAPAGGEVGSGIFAGGS